MKFMNALIMTQSVMPRVFFCRKCRYARTGLPLQEQLDNATLLYEYAIIKKCHTRTVCSRAAHPVCCFSSSNSGAKVNVPACWALYLLLLAVAWPLACDLAVLDVVYLSTPGLLLYPVGHLTCRLHTHTECNSAFASHPCLHFHSAECVQLLVLTDQTPCVHRACKWKIGDCESCICMSDISSLWVTTACSYSPMPCWLGTACFGLRPLLPTPPPRPAAAAADGTACWVMGKGGRPGSYTHSKR